MPQLAPMQNPLFEYVDLYTCFVVLNIITVKVICVLEFIIGNNLKSSIIIISTKLVLESVIMIIISLWLMNWKCTIAI